MDAYLTYAVGGKKVIWYMWTMCQMVKHVVVPARMRLKANCQE